MSPAKNAPPDPRSAKIREQFEALIAPTVTAAGYDLEELTVRSVGRRNQVRVVIDSDSGVELDAVAKLSRSISDVLDVSASDGFSEPYVLEVTSPGVDRPLTLERHWQRACQRLVQVEVDGVKLAGRIIAVDSQGVRLALSTGERTVPFAALGQGRVQIEFNRPTGESGDQAPEGLNAELDDAEYEESDESEEVVD